MSRTLYDQDYYLWLEKTIQLLQKQHFNRLDLAHLIEELEDMGRSAKRAVTSNLRILLMHLLKSKYQPQQRTHSWRYTIFEHRKRLQEAFEDSPSLKDYFADCFNQCYADARKAASLETGLPIETFPPSSPFTQEQVLDSDFFPF